MTQMLTDPLRVLSQNTTSSSIEDAKKNDMDEFAISDINLSLLLNGANVMTTDQLSCTSGINVLRNIDCTKLPVRPRASRC